MYILSFDLSQRFLVFSRLLLCPDAGFKQAMADFMAGQLKDLPVLVYKWQIHNSCYALPWAAERSDYTMLWEGRALFTYNACPPPPPFHCQSERSAAPAHYQPIPMSLFWSFAIRHVRKYMSSPTF